LVRRSAACSSPADSATGGSWTNRASLVSRRIHRTPARASDRLLSGVLHEKHGIVPCFLNAHPPVRATGCRCASPNCRAGCPARASDRRSPSGWLRTGIRLSGRQDVGARPLTAGQDARPVPATGGRKAKMAGCHVSREVSAVAFPASRLSRVRADRHPWLPRRWRPPPFPRSAQTSFAGAQGWRPRRRDAQRAIPACGIP